MNATGYNSLTQICWKLRADHSGVWRNWLRFAIACDLPSVCFDTVGLAIRPDVRIYNGLRNEWSRPI